MEVRVIRDDEWEAYREVRLRALREAPYAFGTTYEEASRRDEGTWRKFTARLAAQAESTGFVLDRGDGQMGGLVTVRFDLEGAGRGGAGEDAAEVNQMWLDEDLRGQGNAERLLHACEEVTRARSVNRVVLWVEDENPRAARVYERCGYRRTGVTEPNERGGRSWQFAKVVTLAP